MIRAILSFCVRERLVVLILTGAVIAYGWYATSQVPQTAMPTRAPANTASSTFGRACSTAPAPMAAPMKPKAVMPPSDRKPPPTLPCAQCMIGGADRPTTPSQKAISPFSIVSRPPFVAIP